MKQAQIVIPQVEVCNPKAEAWRNIGSSFWNSTDVEGRPSEEEIEIYCNGISAEHQVLIIGASTFFLIKRLVDLGASVTVLDFSHVMVDALRLDIAADNLTVHVCDVTSSEMTNHYSNYDFLIADRLINRFSENEFKLAIQNFKNMIAKFGEIRLGVKIGLYDLDEKIIEELKKKNKESLFLKSESLEVNYSKIPNELSLNIFPHGDQPMDVIIDWYLKRGVEKRYTPESLIKLSEEFGGLHVRKNIKFSQTVNTHLFVLESK